MRAGEVCPACGEGGMLPSQAMTLSRVTTLACSSCWRRLPTISGQGCILIQNSDFYLKSCELLPASLRPQAVSGVVRAGCSSKTRARLRGGAQTSGLHPAGGIRRLASFCLERSTKSLALLSVEKPLPSA